MVKTDRTILKGLIIFSREAEEKFKKVLEDLKDYPQRDKFLKDFQKAREAYTELPICYIRYNQTTFRIKENGIRVGKGGAIEQVSKENTDAFLKILHDEEMVRFRPINKLWAQIVIA